MGIRLDQLHSEVFNKISLDLSKVNSDVKDYIENKIADLDVVFGLPETTHIERDVETNKRNLEKSGFIEINRNFVSFRTGDQAATGVWISNLNTNESPFEPQTIDGQKRGINVAGHIINYTKGNIGQDINRMMNLPIAPNLPAFFPEDNDMVYNFFPKKTVVHQKIVTDNAVQINVVRGITDNSKIQINKMLDTNGFTYYYMDDDSNVYYLNNAGRSYFQNAPETLLLEPYKRYTNSFGNKFTFEKIYNNNAVVKYVDLSTNKLFEIKSPIGSNTQRIELTDGTSKVYLADMTITRVIEENGILTPKEITQKMLVKFNIQKKMINGMENHELVKTIVSEAGFIPLIKTINGVDYTYITDENINMYVEKAETYFYYPFRKYQLDENGDRTLDESSNPIMVDDEEYKVYLIPGSAKPTTKNVSGAVIISVIDNLTGTTIEKLINTLVTAEVVYYRIDSMMTGNTGKVEVTLDENGVINNGVEVNQNRPLRLTVDNKISTLTDGSTVILSEGKEFFYHHEVGTKYYLTKNTNSIYYVDLIGNLYMPSSDVQEIFEGTILNLNTSKIINTMFYAANGMMFYIDNENLRIYIADSKQQIQLTDLNGYRVFTKQDGTKIYVVTYDKMVTINAIGVETIVTNISYKDIIPVFETNEVKEEILNLIIPIAFNIVQGNIELSRNGILLTKYVGYEVEALLTLDKDLEFNEETNVGDTLYIKRSGKKDIILRMEKKGTAINDVSGHWANNSGDIVMPEPLTGNYFDWTDGEELLPGEQLDYNDVVKKNNRYFIYTGTAISYDDMPANDKKIKVQESGVFWEDITVSNLEYERKGQNYKVLNCDKGDFIRFTITRRVWEQHAVTGEMTVVEKAPYIVEKTALNSGENLFVLNDANFLIDNNASLESHILLIENIRPYTTYSDNRANAFLLTLTGLQTVAKNTDSAMIYGEDYFLANNILKLVEANKTDSMNLTRIQAPQTELKIEFTSDVEQPKITVPFEIIKNKYDIVVPAKLDGHEYTWIMGEELPEGKNLNTGDVIFDKNAIKFYKYVGLTKGTNVIENGVQVFKPTLKESLLRQSEDIQKEILRQYLKIAITLNNGEYWDAVNNAIVARATKIVGSAGLNIVFIVKDSLGKDVLSTEEKAVQYLKEAKALMLTEAIHLLNDARVDAFATTTIMTDAIKLEIKRILATNLDQSVLKRIKYNADNSPMLDEDGNIVYEFEYTRNFTVEMNNAAEFIERTIFGVESVLVDNWVDITAKKVGYYRFGKTFTILDTKNGDDVLVRLLASGAEEFTSTRVTSKGGEITFAIDFNIELEDDTEIAFEVIYEEINWTEGLDYIQEGQTLTLNMIDKSNQRVIIRRNDAFDLIDIVVLERKDLVFIEVWHEAVSETGYIFPFGNVQYQGTVADNVTTSVFDHAFYDTIDGETIIIPNGHKKYCQVYQKGNVVYNYYAGTVFDPLNEAGKKYIDSTFVEDSTIGRGWKLEDLSEVDRKTIFQNSDHNLYFDGEALIQVRYRTRVVGLNLFENYFKGTSEYMSKGLKFQGKSPVTSRLLTREIGEEASSLPDGTANPNSGQPITETVQIFVGGDLVISSDNKSLLYKSGKLFDDALFTVTETTNLSSNGYVYAIPIAIVNRRNQGVYHPEFNSNGTGFFINGIHVSEDKEDFADDISGFTLVDENDATLATSSVGRDRKAKFKVMLKWLFSTDYKAGGSMVSRTTYRPDSLLYDEINTKDIIDLRIDANDQRKRIEDLEGNVVKGFKDLAELAKETTNKFEQTTNYINTTSNLLYAHIAKTEDAVRKDMQDKDEILTKSLEKTNVHLADLSANVFTKGITKNLLIDSIVGLTDYNTNASFETGKKPTRDEIESMMNSFVENMEGPYTRPEFMKFLVTVLKSITDKTMLSNEELDRWIRRLSVKDLAADADSIFYSRTETIELIYEGLILASSARVLPPQGSDSLDQWEWIGTRFDGWLGSKVLDLNSDFINNGRTPVATKKIKTTIMTKTYSDIKGQEFNAGYIAGPTIWGNVHNYHVIYSTWIFVSTPFKVDYVKMDGDDSHAIFINEELVASNKYCCRDTAYSYDFSVAGWYRIDMVYSERSGGHYIQLGWNPKDYTDKIKYMTTTNMDEAVRITKLRLDNWSSKLKTLVATIKGDASGYFTKLETKLILTEGLQRIRTHVLTFGTSVTASNLNAFHTVGDITTAGLESWLDNINNDGKFSSLGYTVQPDKSADGTEIARSDEFRPIADLSGKYNKEEVVEIIRKGFQLVNGIDSINYSDVQKWVNRLNISINMSTLRYFNKTQIDALIKAGSNYLVGLDKRTSHEISLWLDNHILEKGTVFVDPNGVDKAELVNTNTYTKSELHSLVSTEFKKTLGAQSAKTQN